MASITTTAPILLGGFTIPWETLRTLMPDDRWVVHCAGWITAPGPAVRASIVYQVDGGSLIEVGGANLPASGKAEIGPYPVRGEFAVAKGVPKGERIISVALRAGLTAAGTAASMTRWTMWLRMSPRSA